MKKRIYQALLYAVTTTIIGVIVYSYGIHAGRTQTQRQVQVSVMTQKPMLDYINEVRAKYQRSPLIEDPLLDKTAKIKAEDMVANHYWSHSRPNGETFDVMIRRERPGSDFIGENLGKCYATVQQLVDAWTNSDEHLQNIINSDFTEFGSYMAWDSQQSCFIAVNHFGR